MNKKKLIGAIVGIAVLVGLVVGMLFLYDKFAEKPVEGSKSITVEVIDDKEKSTTYELKTDAEYLKEALDEIEDLEMSGEETEFGFTIYEVNGLNTDFAGSYWGINVNGEVGMYGASQQPVKDGDAFQLVYTIYVAE